MQELMLAYRVVCFRLHPVIFPTEMSDDLLLNLTCSYFFRRGYYISTQCMACLVNIGIRIPTRRQEEVSCVGCDLDAGKVEYTT
jgi:hypothetical protein